MEKIEHRTVQTNGVNIHIASAGTGPDTILFLHGFPEFWYSWRNQLPYFASQGYRAVAPDMRGYGDSDAPPSASSYTALHVVGDLIGLLDALEIEKVFLVGHDWGALIAWYMCLFRPDRVKALVNMSVVFQPRNPKVKIVDGFRALLGDDFYICRFQMNSGKNFRRYEGPAISLFTDSKEPGEVEEEFARVDTAKLMKKFLADLGPEPLCVPKELGFSGLAAHEISLPPWLTEEEINCYARKLNEKGFTGGLNYYRALNLTWELTAPWAGLQIKVPVKFIVGDLDLTYHFPGVKDYINGGGFKKLVPLLQDVVVMEGVGHFLHQEKAAEINEHILDFIKKF